MTTLGWVLRQKHSHTHPSHRMSLRLIVHHRFRVNDCVCDLLFFSTKSSTLFIYESLFCVIIIKILNDNHANRIPPPSSPPKCKVFVYIFIYYYSVVWCTSSKCFGLKNTVSHNFKHTPIYNIIIIIIVLSYLVSLLLI